MNSEIFERRYKKYGALGKSITEEWNALTKGKECIEAEIWNTDKG